MNAWIKLLILGAVITGFPYAGIRRAVAEGTKEGVLTGVIAGVDLKRQEVAVKLDQSTKSFVVDQATRIVTREKEDAMLSDLKAGDEVHVHYTETKGVVTVQKIVPKKPTLGEAIPPGEKPPVSGSPLENPVERQ